MKPLRVLLVEDTPSQVTVISQILKDPALFQFETRPDPASAEDYAKTTIFDVALVDLNLTDPSRGKKVNFNGIPLAARLRDLRPTAPIIMYSSGILPNRENEFIYAKECENIKGAYLFSAAKIISSTATALYETLLDKVQRVREEVAQAHPVEGDGKLSTRALADAFGVESTEHLIRIATPGLEHVKYAALQPGYSGSAIVRISGHNVNGGLHVRRILKISRSKEALSDELRRCPPMGSYYEAKSYLPADAEVRSFDGLHVVTVPEVVDMMPLAGFLSGSTLTNADKKVLTSVVDELLVVPAQHSKAFDSKKHSSDDYRLRDAALHAIVKWLEEAAKWSSILKATDRAAISQTSLFAEAIDQGLWTFSKDGSHVASLHGDFHCQNVFVAEGSAPVLIDFGRAAVLPRLFDFAALDVDLMLVRTLVDRGQQHGFTNIDRLFRDATHGFPFEPGKGPSPNSRSGYLRFTLRDRLAREINGVSQREYAEVLLFNLLRYLRFPNVTAPRKVLACRLISRLLTTFGFSSSSSKLVSHQVRRKRSSSRNHSMRPTECPVAPSER